MKKTTLLAPLCAVILLAVVPAATVSAQEDTTTDTSANSVTWNNWWNNKQCTYNADGSVKYCHRGFWKSGTDENGEQVNQKRGNVVWRSKTNAEGEKEVTHVGFFKRLHW